MKRLFVINEHTLCVGSGDIQFRACSQDTIATPLSVYGVKQWSTHRIGEDVIPKEGDLIRLATEQDIINFEFVDYELDKELTDALSAQKEHPMTISGLFELAALLHLELKVVTGEYSRTVAEFHSVKTSFDNLTSQFEIASSESNKHGMMANDIALTDDQLSDEARWLTSQIASSVDSIATSYLYLPMPEQAKEFEELTAGALQGIVSNPYQSVSDKVQALEELAAGRLQRMFRKDTQAFIIQSLLAYTWLYRRHAIAVEVYQLMIRALYLQPSRAKLISRIKQLTYDYKVVQQVLASKGHNLKSLTMEPNLDLMESEMMTTARLVADIRAMVDGYNANATWTQLA